MTAADFFKRYNNYARQTIHSGVFPQTAGETPADWPTWAAEFYRFIEPKFVEGPSQMDWSGYELLHESTDPNIDARLYFDGKRYYLSDSYFAPWYAVIEPSELESFL
ncbi:MAG: hypothetical protein ACYSWU_16455 [Planctomycetota bacterium]|jgi:hypothetical protein